VPIAAMVKALSGMVNARDGSTDSNGSDNGEPNPYILSRSDKEKLKTYTLYKEAHPNTTDYSDGLTPESKSRESALLGVGYLRYRRVYIGSDWYKPAGAMYAGLVPKRDGTRSHFASRDRVREPETA
jgi:hypothetical protein